jgi:hypothetical protein
MSIFSEPFRTVTESKNKENLTRNTLCKQTVVVREKRFFNELFVSRMSTRRGRSSKNNEVKPELKGPVDVRNAMLIAYECNEKTSNMTSEKRLLFNPFNMTVYFDHYHECDDSVNGGGVKVTFKAKTGTVTVDEESETKILRMHITRSLSSSVDERFNPSAAPLIETCDEHWAFDEEILNETEGEFESVIDRSKLKPIVGSLQFLDVSEVKQVSSQEEVGRRA